MRDKTLVRVPSKAFDAVLPKKAILPSDNDTTRKFLEEYDRTQRPFRTKWRCEILGTSIKVPNVQFRKPEAEHDVTLDEEIQRCWFETEWSYSYGLFQSATLLTCIIVELTIERYLRSKDLWQDYEKELEERNRTLGSLIAFCRDGSKRGAYLTTNILEKCGKLNGFRIEAAHMNKRRSSTLRIPPNFSSNEIDEIENVSQPSANVPGEKKAFFTPDEPGILFDASKQDFYKVLAFKRYAREAISLTSEITKLIFQLY